MLASTHGDAVVGIDAHWEMVPSPAGAPIPTPIPNPFVGMVFDPAGLAVGLAITQVVGALTGAPPTGAVIVNGMPATNTGTEATGLGHMIIPPGTSWAPVPSVMPVTIPKHPPPMPDNPASPNNDAVIITGSKTVHVMGSNFARLGDFAMSCSEPVRLPSSAIVTVPKGLPVLVGGPPDLDAMAAAGSFIRTQWVSHQLNNLLSHLRSVRLRNLLHRAVCFLTGHPVDVATGRVFTDRMDFELPGPIPLRFERVYSSGFSERRGPLGFGWSHSLDQKVWEERGKIVYRTEDGREVEFDTFELPEHRMRAGDELYYPVDRLTLRCLGERGWEIWNADGIGHEFSPVIGGDPAIASLRAKKTRDGHRIELHYDDRGLLSWVRDSGKRQIRFVHDDAGRLVSVKLPVPKGEGHFEHTRYAYDAHGDLVRVTDPLGHFWQFEYAGHLLTRETDRERLSFYFGYDGIGQDAWCVRTWGDGGIYDHQLTYDKVGKVTAVANSLGHTTIYRMDLVGCVTDVIDPHGASTKYEYDPSSLQPTLEQNAAGETTRRSYDDRGNLVRLERPDDAVTSFAYHDQFDCRVRAVDPNGHAWSWEYDSFGRMTGAANPLGHSVRYVWEAGLLASATTPGGSRTSFGYDDAGNLQHVVLPTGGELHYATDRLGRVEKFVDACGGVEERSHDRLGSLIERREPHGLVQRFEFDREENLTRAVDALHDVSLTYTGFYWFHERHEADVVVRHHYDLEGQRTVIENEAREVHRFERDALGLIASEVGFDGARYHYERDAVGRLARIRKPSGRTDTLRYDPCGRLAHVAHSDGSAETYRYDPEGWLTEATNASATVRFGRDEMGRVVVEAVVLPNGTERWVRSGYGPDGERVHVESSDGHLHHVEWDPAGNVRRIELERVRWHVDFERNAHGRETRRTFASGLSAAWRYDPVGRPTHRTITAGGEALARTEYNWEDDQLHAVRDASMGNTFFHYDRRGRLAWTRMPWGEEQHRVLDDAGNVFATPAMNDRRYAPGGRIEEAEGTQYKHDADGNLIEEIDLLGTSTRYRWNDEGMLAEVELPDGTAITFTYDAFARRLSKRVGPREDGPAAEVQWTWDGDVPLTEVHSEHGKTTWLFEPRTYNPLAKLADGKIWGVLTDQLGVPTELVAEDNSFAWQGSLDTYGNVAETKRATSNPFRYPGQICDEETGLHYNRNRYYHPTLGQYISKDPIGLNGGLRARAYVDDPNWEIDPDGLEVRIDSQGFFADRHEYGRGSGSGRVRIPYQGNRGRDFTVADRAAGFGPGNPRPAGYVWHHANYNARTGFGDMQLVRRSVHEARSHHGGASQFTAATGLAYDTPAAVRQVESEGRLRGRPCK